MNNERRILAVAYACNPYRGSEHGVGWGWVKMISEEYHVDVISAAFEREDIERWLQENPGFSSRINFYYPEHKFWHYHKTSKMWRRIEHSFLKIIMNWVYRLWQLSAYRLARRLCDTNDYSLCHLITYVGFRFPGGFHKLKLPFVWGPIGGLENTPWHLLPLTGVKGAFYYSLRNIINSLDKRFLNSPKRAFARAEESGAVIAATSSIRNEIDKAYGVESAVICEIGIDKPPEHTELCRKDGAGFRMAWSGEHLPGKALPLLLLALRKMSDEVDWRLDILGEGSCTRNWQSMAQRLGLSERCRWHGNVSRDSAWNVMRMSHAFIITSMKDLTSSVLLESIMFGVPVICPDHCGFTDVVDETCGIKIPVDDRNKISKLLRAAIISLANDEGKRLELSRGAKKRAEDYSWRVKAGLLEEVYNQALMQGADDND